MLAAILIIIVATAHIAFLVLEMFLWAKPLGLKITKMKESQAKNTEIIAKNVGLYNGFLAVGLLWALWQGAVAFIVFLLLWIITAGIYGGLTSQRIIAYIQAGPAILALFFVVVFGVNAS